MKQSKIQNPKSKIAITPEQSKIIALATTVLLTLELAALVAVLLQFVGLTTALRRGAFVLALLVLPYPTYALLARFQWTTLVRLNVALLTLPVLAAFYVLFTR